MDMDILKGEKRKNKLNSKQLRRQGVVPGVMYGSGDNTESLSIQFPQKDVLHFLTRNIIGSRVNLEIDGEEQMALLKEINYTPVTNEVEHLTFMPLVKGEKIITVAPIILLNKEKVPATVQHTLYEISYKALPKDLFDTIEIDLTGVQIGASARVEDLEVSKNEAIEVLTPGDTQVFAIVERKELAIGDEGDEAATESDKSTDRAD